MLELNGDIYYKVFEVGKIPSYMDPKKKYNEDYIFQVAKNYDPVNVHEAPFWVGHPEYMSEPKAGGWIKKVVAVGKELYVSFSDILPWMKELYDSGEFKKCSVEMGDLEINSEGESIPYLWALGATNIPAVKGLEPLKFSDDSKLHNRVCFSLINFDYKTKQKPKTMDTIKKLADSLGIKYNSNITEEDLSLAIDDELKRLKSSESDLSTEINKITNDRVIKLIDRAVTSGKITPAQKEEFESFAKTNFDQCEKILESLPGKVLTDTQIKAQSNFAKSNQPDVTYDEILRNPDKFIGVLDEEEILALRSNSVMFKDTNIL